MSRIQNISSGLSNPVQWLVDWFRGGDADSGVKVTLETALGDASVWGAVQKISSHIGLMPLNLRKSKDRGSEIASNNTLHSLTTQNPNAIQTPFVFKQTLMLHALLAGNGRAAIIRRNGVPIELIPMLPSQTLTCMVDGAKWHAVIPNKDDQLTRHSSVYNRGESGDISRIPDSDVLHIPGLSYSGFVGLSVVDVLKDVLGIGLGAQKAVSASFKNPKPGVLIHAPIGMFRDDDDAQKFMDDFNSYHTGVDNSNRAGLLRDGMTTSVLPVNASDAQWIEQRKFQRQDIANIFGLEAVLGDGESVSYNSLEQRNLAYLANCLMPWAVKMEQEFSTKLLGRNQRNQMFYRFDQQALLRMDMQTTVTSYGAAIASRIMSPNEARERLDLNPYDGGDEFANPAITPGRGNEPDADESTDVEPDGLLEPQDRSTEKVVAARVRHLIGIECQRVARAASGRKQHLDGKRNFLEWQDSFYARWAETFAKAITEVGGDRDVAEAHCAESQRQLLHLAGEITDQKTWAAAVADLTETWAARGESITNAITEPVAC
jgi:HK97 family phage portal protein